MMTPRTTVLCALLAAGSARAQTPYEPYLVRDLNPTGDSHPLVVGAVGDRAVFQASADSDAPDLWITDGTAAATLLLRDLLSTGGNTALELGDVLVFDSAGGGIWRTDGTAAGTAPVSSVLASAAMSDGAVASGIGMFLADGAFGRTPFVTDGTVAGTHPVPLPVGVTWPGTSASVWPGATQAFAGRLAVAMEHEMSFGTALWLYDPATRETTRLRACEGANSTLMTLGAAGDRLFLNCGSQLWVTDGTNAGTRLVAQLPGVILLEPIRAVDGVAYFMVSPGRLWRSDGTAAGTVPLEAIAPVVAGLTYRGTTTVAGSLLYFDASRADTGHELWRTDGTAAGTFLVKDIVPGPDSGLFPFTHQLAAAGGLLFWATTPASGLELWRTDGTTAGTVLLPEVVPGPGTAASQSRLRGAGGRVYFSADDGVVGRELWARDLPAGAIALDDTVAKEGDGVARFAVRLESPAPAPVVVSYTTVAGTAQAGPDFVAQAGTLTFAPGEREAVVDVAIVADATDEATESFGLAVTTAKGAPVADGRAVAVILDDDGPRVSVAGPSVVEGDSGTVDASFAVTLTTGDGQPTAHAVTVRADVVHGTASSADFPPPPVGIPAPVPSVTFPAGTASGSTLALVVAVLGDALDEPDETFTLALDAGHDAILPDAAPGGVILDDDGVAANSPTEIAHGSRILADLAPPAGRASDVDFYVYRADLHSSYEVVADAVSGDAVPLQVERVVPDGGVLQAAQPTGTGASVALRFFGLGTSDEHLRVRSAACGTTCGTDDAYRLRMYETTLTSPRVNNSGPQATLLVLENTTDRHVLAVAAFWDPSGALAGLRDVELLPHGNAVLDTRLSVSQFSGSLTVAHDAPYGALAGKVVSIDPGTGFAFDTPLAPKPR